MPADQPNPLEEHFTDLISVLPRVSQLSNTMNRGQLVEHAMAASGLDLERPAMSVLMSLLMAGEPLRVGEIARRMQVAGPHVTRLLHNLEGRGLVRRVPDPQDGRARLAELTAPGSEAASRYLRSMFGWFGEALTDWPAEDLETLGRLLVRLLDDLGSYAAQNGAGRMKGTQKGGSEEPPSADG